MREDFSFDTTGVVRKIVRKLAGLIGLTIALYVKFSVTVIINYNVHQLFINCSSMFINVHHYFHGL